MVDAADALGTVLFGYARCSHVAVDRYSHSSRAVYLKPALRLSIAQRHPGSRMYVHVAIYIYI